MADEGLTQARSLDIEFLVDLGLVEEICSRNFVDIDDLSADRSVPVVVCEGAQECLVYCASNKQLAITFGPSL
jgi:hypothetical protein